VWNKHEKQIGDITHIGGCETEQAMAKYGYP
jgi:hypothetical protein